MVRVVNLADLILAKKHFQIVQSREDRQLKLGFRQCPTRGGAFPHFSALLGDCELSELVKLTHIRVTLPRTLFHERAPYLVIEDLWGGSLGDERYLDGCHEIPASGLLRAIQFPTPNASRNYCVCSNLFQEFIFSA